MDNRDPFVRARDYAFLLLKFRLRSICEITQRLKKKKFAPEVIEGTILFLKERSFLDDAVFCRAWVDSRLRKSLGFGRIRQELNLKGIDRVLVEAVISELKSGYCEKEIVRKVAGLKFDKLKSVEPIAAKRRLYAFLIRRGFSPDVASETTNELCKQKS